MTDIGVVFWCWCVVACEIFVMLWAPVVGIFLIFVTVPVVGWLTLAWLWGLCGE